MDKPRALVLGGLGINCELETAHALELGGCKAHIVDFGALVSGKEKLEEYQALVLPGGFSFGDDIQSGRVLANKLRCRLSSPLKKFIDDGKPLIGICNGFQVLTQLGVLPGWGQFGQRDISLMRNASGRFEDRWVKMRVERSKCTFAQGCEYIRAPVRHGEGQVAVRTAADLQRLDDSGQIVFRYAAHDGLAAQSYPDNPNGSADAIAGICNEQGNVLGFMPHPECHVRYTQSPKWTRSPPPIDRHGKGVIGSIKRIFAPQPAIKDDGNSLAFFEGIYAAAKKFI